MDMNGTSLAAIPLSLSGPGKVNLKQKGPWAAFILGLVFGIALGPCTFAYMAPVLAITFSVAKTNPLYALSLLVLYGAGHCSVIVCAGTFTEAVQHYLNWNEQSKGPWILKKICGLLVLTGGFYMIYTAG